MSMNENFDARGYQVAATADYEIAFTAAGFEVLYRRPPSFL